MQVRFALTHEPSILPSIELIPDGISIETFEIFLSFINSIISAAIPFILPLYPVPKIASTIISAASSDSLNVVSILILKISHTSIPILRIISRLIRASPFKSLILPMRKTDISAFLFLSHRAITKPSPPLLPLPHTIIIFLYSRGPYSSSILSTVPLPAFSIKTTPGIPTSSIAHLSIFFISSGFTSFIIYPYLIFGIVKNLSNNFS